MSKRLNKFFELNVLPKNLRKLFFLFLCHTTLLLFTDDENNYILAQSCSNLKFPLTFGFSSGETEIISID